jgi:carbonic anhydrase
MENSLPPSPKNLGADFSAGIVVFLVALPLCLGIAFASNAPLISGLVSGVVGGLLVALLSGSHTSVSGPAAGLAAIVAAKIAGLGSFEALLTATILAGVLQIVMGVLKLGFISTLFPNSVIKGLLAAIGLILIFKQVPHLVGYDKDPEGDFSFQQADQKNTLSEIFESLTHIQEGAAVIGVLCLVFIMVWDKKKPKNFLVPTPLLVVLIGTGLSLLFAKLGGVWLVENSHLVNVPVFNTLGDLWHGLPKPNFALLKNQEVWIAAGLIGGVASLETLLNLQAVDKIDRYKRQSPQDRELVAQGVGNVACGLVGGLPLTSVIVRSSANIAAGNRTKLSCIIHGVLLLVCVVVFPKLLNLIPLSCLGAILIATGLKLANWQLIKQMWSEGWNQFIPFVATVAAIFFTDLLTGTLLGLGVALFFLLRSNAQNPINQTIEHHVTGDITRISLAENVGFISKNTLEKTLRAIPHRTSVVIDATNTEYMDSDIVTLLDDFRRETAPAHQLNLSMLGFKNRYPVKDQIEHVDFTTRELQDKLTPDAVIEIFKRGNDRFVSGKRITRDFTRQVDATAAAQFPMAVVLSCIDSRSPVEIIFDLGLGDAFVARVAGNIAKDKVLASMEFATAVAGAKLVLVMGHTNCGAVKAAVDLFETGLNPAEATGCQHIDALVSEIQKSIESGSKPANGWASDAEKLAFVDKIAEENVKRTVSSVRSNSQTLAALEQAGKIRLVGAVYNLKTGIVNFLG